MRSTPSFRRSVIIVAALGAAAMTFLPACGSDDAADDAAATTTTTTEAEAAPSPEVSPEDQEVVDSATELCEAYGGLDQPGAVDALLGTMSDDIVVTDTVLGADLTGTEAVRAYVTSDAFAGIDTMDCGAAVQRGDWVAGSYTLSNSTTSGGGEGIAAIHVTDGKVDRQINYYTPVESGAVAPESETIVDSALLDYCHAWDDGADADEVLSYMSTDPELQVVTTFTGADAIRTFIDTAFDFDVNDCGDEAVTHGDWGAAANTFSSTVNGTTIEGVNVVLIGADGTIAKHFVHMDSGTA